MKLCTNCGKELTIENTRLKKSHGKEILYSICLACEKNKRIEDAKKKKAKKLKNEPIKEVKQEPIKEPKKEIIQEVKKEPIQEEKLKRGYELNKSTLIKLGELKLYKIDEPLESIVDRAICELHTKLFKQK